MSGAAAARSQRAGGGDSSEIPALEAAVPLLQPYFFRTPGTTHNSGVCPQTGSSRGVESPSLGCCGEKRSHQLPVHSRVLQWKRDPAVVEKGSGGVSSPQEPPGLPTSSWFISSQRLSRVCLSAPPPIPGVKDLQQLQAGPSLSPFSRSAVGHHRPQSLQGSHVPHLQLSALWHCCLSVCLQPTLYFGISRGKVQQGH